METLYIRNKLKLILFLLIPILFWFINYKSTDNDFSFCLIKNIWGIKCYGCGLSRGISAVLHLKFEEAFNLNKVNLFSIPIIFIIYAKSLFHLIIQKKSKNKFTLFLYLYLLHFNNY